MKIGILNCDFMQPHHRRFGGAFSDLFVRMFEQYDSDFCFKVYHLPNGQHPESPDECDGYLVTGSHRGVYENEPWIHKAKQLIKALFESRKKLVGVCFGHQLLAEVLGGRVEKSDKGWGVGVHQVNLLSKKDWMKPELDDYALNVCHQDQVVQLPKGAECLASNAHCQNALFVIGDQCLGIQAHPEITADYLAAILDDRAHLIGNKRVERAKESLLTRTDEKVVTSWICHFLRAS